MINGFISENIQEQFSGVFFKGAKNLINKTHEINSKLSHLQTIYNMSNSINVLSLENRNMLF